MVDLRPLLFVNALVLLLFMAAGFQSLVGHTASDESTPAESTAAAEPQAVTEETAVEAATSAPAGTENDAEALMNRLAGDQVAPAATETAAATQADNSVFLDPAAVAQEVPAETAVNAAESEASVATPPITSRTPAIKPVQQPEIVQEALPEPQVLSAQSTPTEEPAAITGRLTIQSNVSGDTVLINGKPYGSSKLEVELTPGTYSIEVAKDGYSSWSTKVEMRPGLDKTLKAQLNLFNTVEYKDGIWRNNVMTGEGTYAEKGVMEYTGSFVNGKFHGSGSARYATGLKYQGSWSEGKMQGNGSLTTPEGDTYVG